MRKLVILRPEPGAGQTLERARERGLEAVVIPLFRVTPVAWDVPDLAGMDGLLVTSANAVREAGRRISELRGLRAYAVGEATANALRHAGIEVAVVGRGGVDDLLAGMDPALRLLHLCGEDRRDGVGHRGEIVPLVVYRSEPLDQPGSLDLLLDSVAMVHSPRGGRRLSELWDHKGRTVVAAISPAAAEACGPGWQQIATADAASDHALLSLAERLCKDSRPS